MEPTRDDIHQAAKEAMGICSQALFESRDLNEYRDTIEATAALGPRWAKSLLLDVAKSYEQLAKDLTIEVPR